MRLKAGSLFAPENDTPIVVRYFSGGANMRGFYQRRLSPQIAVPTFRPDDACAGMPNCPTLPYYTEGVTLPLGGAGLLEGALEVRWQVSESWVLAIFNDWGLVTTEPLGARTNLGQSLYTAVGLGVRYRTPLGPIRVDLGFRLPFVGGAQQVGNLGGTDGGDVKAVQSAPGCFFGLGSGLPIEKPFVYGATPAAYGGSPDNLCSAHLSIGEAF
jgi:outer membrane protein assembly factor BamA